MAAAVVQILNGRTEKRQIGNRAGNSFSVATFAAGPQLGAITDKDYWAELLPEALQELRQKVGTS